jgi:hypothetical protein
MRFQSTVILSAFATFGAIAPASATTRIQIDLSTQTMHVESSSGSYDWPVSTARAGYSTPRGYYAPTGLQRMHYSRKYHMSPMPYSIFFRGGYAIHGTYATGALGTPASHGCVRLSPEHAAALYHMVQSEGGRISITGSPAGATRFARGRYRDATQFASLNGRRYSYSYGQTMAYAPNHYPPARGSVRSWQRSPLSFIFPGF